MKRLQNNYTTQEQSKRLLEFGVPAWTADCFYDHFGYKNIRDSELELSKDFFSNTEKYYYKHEGASPCWSVGRLIEIYEICTQRKFNRRNQTDNLVYLSPLEDVLMQIEHNACGFYDNTKWDTNLLNG